MLTLHSLWLRHSILSGYLLHFNTWRTLQPIQSSARCLLLRDALAELAQQKVVQINKPEILNYLIEQITAEPDEAVVRALLRPTAA